MPKSNTQKHAIAPHFTRLDLNGYADAVGGREPDEVLFLGQTEVHIYDYGSSHKVFIVDCMSGNVLMRECQGGYKPEITSPECKSIMSGFSCLPKNRV